MIKYLQADSTAAVSLSCQWRLDLAVKKIGEKNLYPRENLVRNQSTGNRNVPVEISK